MNIGLHDADAEHMPRKTFPNYVLMKLSAYYKAKGGTVAWWTQPLEPFDLVYSSKVFDFTETNPFLPQGTIFGGTGYGLYQELPPEVDNCYPDYSIYPACDYALGFLTRGCPNQCRWCVVPRKEGAIHAYRDWRQVVRQDSNKLVLMDNNILAIDYGLEQLQSLIGTGYRIDLNQGMDARLVTPKIAELLARLDWIRYIRFSCDQLSQIEPVIQACELLQKYGKRPYNVFVYLLVTSDLKDASKRVEAL